jgi:hypothetical protein
LQFLIHSKAIMIMSHIQEAKYDQSLVGLVVIDAGLGRGLKPLDIRTDSRTRLSGLVCQILVVKTKKRTKI